MSQRQRSLLLAVMVIVGGTVVARMLGYKVGGNTVVRCRRGHLFTTLWVPGVKLRGLELGLVRLQRCPVGSHWTLIVPVKDSTLTVEERRSAAQHHDLWLP
jgi:hypothetical protein